MQLESCPLVMSRSYFGSVGAINQCPGRDGRSYTDHVVSIRATQAS